MPAVVSDKGNWSGGWTRVDPAPDGNGAVRAEARVTVGGRGGGRRARPRDQILMSSVTWRQQVRPNQPVRD